MKSRRSQFLYPSNGEEECANANCQALGDEVNSSDDIRRILQVSHNARRRRHHGLGHGSFDLVDGSLRFEAGFSRCRGVSIDWEEQDISRKQIDGSQKTRDSHILRNFS